MSNGIARPKGTKVLITPNGNTADIVKAVLAAVPEVREQTRDFARQFDPGNLYELWHWVRTNIHYNEDPLGVQWIREPARLWYDREGDCKSFTVFIVSVLENMGVDYKIRFVNTERPGSRLVNHVYPIALVNGSEIIIDAVYGRYNAEHKFYYKKDYSMADIYRLAGGVGSLSENELQQYWDEIRRIDNEIPDSVFAGGDITAMTRGQFLRFQQAEQFEAKAENATADEALRFRAAADAVRTGNISGLRGIGAFSPSDEAKVVQFLQSTTTMTERAFVPPVIEIPNGGVSGLGDRIKDLAKDILNVWKKALNWMFKMALPVAAPFFLYTFIKKKGGRGTEARKAKQQKILNWIQTVGKFDSPGDVLNAIRSGIVKKFGKQPEQVLNDAAKGKIAGIGIAVTAITAAIVAVVEVIDKLVGIFKKKKTDVPAPGMDAAPNAEELEQEFKSLPDPVPASVPTPTPSAAADDAAEKDNKSMYWLAAAAAGLFLFSKF